MTEPNGLPASVEIERSVLGCILLDNACFEQVELSIEHFSDPRHRYIYGIIAEMREAGLVANIVTVADLIGSRRQLDTAGGVAYIADLTSMVVLDGSLANYVKVLQDTKQLRDIIYAARLAITQAESRRIKPAEILKTIEQATVQIASDIQVKENDIFLNVEQFTNRYNQEIEWRVDGAIEVGTNGILVGASGDGKSPVARALAVCLAAGVDWLDLRVKRTRTALISREDYPGTTSRFIRRFISGTGIMASEIGLKHWLYIHSREQKKQLFLDDPADLRLLINNLKSRQIEFAIFDVFNIMHKADENDNTEVRKVLNCIDLIRGETGCQIMLLHHSNKTGGTRGASATDGFGEFIWKLSTEEGDGDDALRKVRFARVKSGFAHKPIYFKIVNQENGGVTLERQPIEEQKTQPSQVRAARVGK